MRWTDFLRDVATAAGVGNITSSLKRHLDDFEVATDVSDNTAGNRKGEITFAASGHPGAVYHEETISGQVNRRSSLAFGTIFPEEIPDMLEFLGDGVFPGIDNKLAPFGDGSGMQVKVKTGKGMQLGHLYRHGAEQTYTVTAADPTNPRKDRLVLRLTRPGQVEAGKHEIVVKAGTPGATPVKPGLTQSAATWETALATIDVPAGAASIVAANVLDERQPAVPMATGSYPFVAGHKYDLRSMWSVTVPSAGSALVANRLYGVPLFVPWTTTFDRIGIWVLSGSANARFGVHQVGFDGNPGALLIDAGALALSVGENAITTSFTLPGGRWYILSLVSDGTPSVRKADWNTNGAQPAPFGVAVFGDQIGAGLVYRAFTYATLPDPFGTTGLTFPAAEGGQNEDVPLIGLRAA